MIAWVTPTAPARSMLIPCPISVFSYFCVFTYRDVTEISSKFAKATVETSTCLPWFLTAHGSFTCTTRSAQGLTCFLSSHEGLDIQSGMPARLVNKVQCCAWVDPGFNPGPLLCSLYGKPVQYKLSGHLIIIIMKVYIVHYPQLQLEHKTLTKRYDQNNKTPKIKRRTHTQKHP